MDDSFAPTHHRPNPTQTSSLIWWMLGIPAGIGFVCCSGLLLLAVYIGTLGPATSVYTGNRVPSRFLRVMEEVGALDKGEKIEFFYSDALSDIREGFYHVSEKRVVVYIGSTDTQLTSIRFDSIAEINFYQSDSFFEDSEVEIFDHEGMRYSFPLSNEFGRDQRFVDAIRNRSKTFCLKNQTRRRRLRSLSLLVSASRPTTMNTTR